MADWDQDAWSGVGFEWKSCVQQWISLRSSHDITLTQVCCKNQLYVTALILNIRILLVNMSSSILAGRILSRMSKVRQLPMIQSLRMTSSAD